MGVGKRTGVVFALALGLALVLVFINSLCAVLASSALVEVFCAVLA